MNNLRPYLNFAKHSEGNNIKPILKELNAAGDVFNAMPVGLMPWQPGYQHREMYCFCLRRTDWADDALENPASYQAALTELNAYDLPLYAKFPSIRKFVYKLMQETNASQIGRVAVAMLPSQARIYGHYDHGLYYDYYTRFHLMIEGARDNWMHCGEEEGQQEHLEMLTGECWSFNHLKWHYFTNRSERPRIYLCIDLRVETC
jgi:hypothetical protein